MKAIVLLVTMISLNASAEHPLIAKIDSKVQCLAGNKSCVIRNSHDAIAESARKLEKIVSAMQAKIQRLKNTKDTICIPMITENMSDVAYKAQVDACESSVHVAEYSHELDVQIAYNEAVLYRIKVQEAQVKNLPLYKNAQRH